MGFKMETCINFLKRLNVACYDPIFAETGSYRYFLIDLEVLNNILFSSAPQLLIRGWLVQAGGLNGQATGPFLKHLK